MSTKHPLITLDKLPRFDRDFFGSEKVLSYIGSGHIGGKASGLAFIKDFLAEHFRGQPFSGITVNIPRLVVIATDAFDNFMERTHLYETANSDLPDDRIAHAFQKAELPAEIVGDLRALIASVSTPLAIRSSSLLEDAMYEPFAGVYTTKMIPNNQTDVDTRFRKLVEAIKYVWASVFFRGAKDYLKIAGKSISDEKMAVIIQEVVGQRHNERYYPHFAGVARSYNFYPIGRAKPEEGVVNLALGLGKTIVDGGLVWSYSPAYPQLTPPVASPSDMLKLTQTEFWAVNMGQPPEHDPIHETEYMAKGNLQDADFDGTLRFVASTYRPEDDRMVIGAGPDGPRAITFAPILVDQEAPINQLIKELLTICEKAVGSAVEIEFAVTLDSRHAVPARFGFLQVRPMVVSDSKIEIEPQEMSGDAVLAASERTMGNGLIDTISDIVFVRPDKFEAKHTRKIATELELINRSIVAEGCRYLLIGFGRWGSSDPWLGIPVEWNQISGAKVIIEATLPGMDVEQSQGSHFFHNLTSFQVCYMSVHHAGQYKIDWKWLEKQKEVAGTDLVSHIRLVRPLTIKVDGRSGRGVILT